MAVSGPSWVSNLLQRESFLFYHAYYLGVRHNHKPHGIVAIAQLGGDKERVIRYCDSLNKHLKKYDPKETLVEKMEIDYLKSDKLEDYRGKNQAFYTMLTMYTEKYKNEYNGDIVKMIKEVCPPILDGHTYAAFHGLIQMAYGYVGNNHQTMLEGITYLDQQYSPMFLTDANNAKRTDLSKFGYGKTDLLDVLGGIRENKALIEKMNEENKRDLQLRKDTQMFGVYGWSGPMYHSQYLLDLADSVKLPEWFDPKQKDMNQLSRLLNWFCDMATVLYVESETINDFFLLHGITAMWSAKHILPMFDFDVALLAFRSSIATIFVVYIMQGVPALTRNPTDFYKGDVTQEAWDKLIAETLNGKDYETHVYKVIQCLYEFWKENPESTFAQYYIAGGYATRDFPYGRGPNATSPNDDLSI